MSNKKPENALSVSAALAQIEQVAEGSSFQALSTRGRVERAYLMAQAIGQLRDLVRPLAGHLMQLQGSPLGFVTDKDKDGGYPPEKVADVIVEAVLRGLYPVDNQFNIISGRLYITKNGYRHLLRTLPEFSDLRTEIEVPRMAQGGAVVECRAAWKYRGKPGSLSAKIAVRLNAGMGADAAVGKAERKLLARIYGQITGSDQTDDGDDVLLPAAPSRTEALADRLEARRNLADNAAVAKIASMLTELEVTSDGYEAICDDLGADPVRLTPAQAEAVLKHLEALRDERAERAAIEAAP